MSYSRKDLAFVDELEAALRQRGVEPLIDRSEIYAFEDWWTRIEALIAKADTILFVLSPDSVASDICAREVAFATGQNKRLAPVVARPVEPDAVPDALRRLNFVFLDEPESYPERLDGLVEALGTDIAWVRRHSELAELARRWQDGGRNPALWLRSPQLEEAESWIARRPANAPAPTDATLDLVLGSRRAATRRRKTVSAALAAGLVVALGLAGLAFWQRQVATESQRNEAAARERAETALASSGRAASGLIFDLARGLRGRGLPITVVADVLGRAETLINELVRSEPNNFALRGTQAAMLTQFAITYAAVGDAVRERATADRAVALGRELAAAQPEDVRHIRNLSAALEIAGAARLHGGDMAGGLALFEEGLAIAERLAAADPADRRAAALTADLTERIADLKVARGDPASALPDYERSLVIRRRLAEADPTSFEYARGLWLNRMRTGDARRALDDRDGALAAFQDALATARRFAAAAPLEASRAHDLAANLNKVAELLSAKGDRAGARKLIDESLTILRRLSAADPADRRLAAELANTLGRLGDVLFADRDARGARAVWEEAVAASRLIHERDPSNADRSRDLAVVLARLGEAMRVLGEFGPAEKTFGESLAIGLRLVQAAPTNADMIRHVALMYGKLILTARASGRPEDGCRLSREGLAFLLSARDRLKPGLLNPEIGYFSAQADACATPPARP